MKLGWEGKEDNAALCIKQTRCYLSSPTGGTKAFVLAVPSCCNSPSPVCCGLLPAPINEFHLLWQITSVFWHP